MSKLAKHTDAPCTDELTRGEGDTTFEAKAGRTDAVNSGLVKPATSQNRLVLKDTHGNNGTLRSALSRKLRRLSSKESGDAGDQAARNISRQAGVSMQSHKNMRAKIAALGVAEMDEAGETQGVADIYAQVSEARSLVNKAQSLRKTRQANALPKVDGSPTANVRQTTTRDRAHAKRFSMKEPAGKDLEAKVRMQSRRTWMKARTAQAKAAETAIQTSAKTGGVKAIAAIASSAAAPLAGVLAGILAFVLAMMVVSQLISALFGFWENEDAKQSVAGLPSYITQEMVITALECQEKYGHPAACTIAQIICESGQGDHLSGLATEDNNLYGIKWSSSYGLAKEVTGHSSWLTSEEEYGQIVWVMAEFTSFTSHKDCIVFRSRVFLQNARFSQNALIQEAIATCDSDKMAEGLKDAGYATSSAYVSSLENAMKTYGLYRFDKMTVEQFKSASANADAIVAAAYSQLGVPYVWGGETPGVGLDCSGLTQYCYATVGIHIPHYTEDQYSAGTPIPLSEAQPGDILYKYGHVAIYIGGDQYIHEPDFNKVCEISSGINYFTCAIRFR